jgi:transcriptional regulator of heat shock response
MAMNEMHDRTAEILEAAIQGFITTGEPVSSGWLFDNYDFGIKPAMIRLELDALEEAGYLEQPHHSAGRIPTDAGYEFFVKQSLLNASEARGHSLDDISARHTLPDVLHELSAELGLLSIAADFARDAVYKSGLEALVNNLDWEDRDEIRSVIRDFEGVDERLPKASEKLREGPNVFIGKKSPVTRSENLSVVCGNYTVNGATVSIFAIGPKRMDYRKVIKIFKNL